MSGVNDHERLYDVLTFSEYEYPPSKNFDAYAFPIFKYNGIIDRRIIGNEYIERVDVEVYDPKVKRIDTIVPKYYRRITIRPKAVHIIVTYIEYIMRFGFELITKYQSVIDGDGVVRWKMIRAGLIRTVRLDGKTFVFPTSNHHGIHIL